MIDYEKLNIAYHSDSFYSLQLEVGDICYQGCIYCYMNAIEKEKNTLSDKNISKILKDCQKLNITAIEWLGGEPLLRKTIFDHMAYAERLGLKNNVWTGGLPLSDDNILEQTIKYAKNGLISVHLSTINEKIYKTLHPKRNAKKDINKIINNVKTVLEKGYPNTQMLNSVTYTGLQDINDMINTIDFFENEFGIKTSLNVYHTYLRPDTPSGELKKFIPDKDNVKKLYKRYALVWDMKTLPMNCVNKQYCSTTIAVLNNGNITPCATIREQSHNLNIHNSKTFYETVVENKNYLTFSQFKNKNNIPTDCKKCGLTDECWGCRSRAYAKSGEIYAKDPRCFRNNETQLS